MGKGHHCFFMTFMVGTIAARSTNILFPDRLLSVNSTDSPSAAPTLPAPDTCGRIKHVARERILNGNPALLGDWPWIVAIGYRNGNGDDSRLSWSCAGALVTEKHVVTAAQCTRNKKPVIARLGELDLDPTVEDGATPIDIQIERVITHERFNGKNRINNNVAILKLKKSVTFTEFIQPICLPVSTNMKTIDLENKVVSVAGWGQTDIGVLPSTRLLEADVPVTNHAECKDTYGSSSVQIDDTVICAGNPEGGKGPCLGDSGGPLIYSKNNQFYLMGVVFYGTHCGADGQPGIYTRVSSFAEWIVQRIDGDYVRKRRRSLHAVFGVGSAAATATQMAG